MPTCARRGRLAQPTARSWASIFPRCRWWRFAAWWNSGRWSRSRRPPWSPTAKSMATWRPPERIKYAPLEAPWPDASQSHRSRLYQPIAVGSTRLNSRTWVPAMVPWRASEEGYVTPAVLARYERFARGRPAALVVEATGVRDIVSGPLLRIGDD